MKHQVAVQQLLNSRFNEAKGKNPSYSLRAFARKISLSHATASRILSGKRGVSRKVAQRIIKALMLDPQESSEILSLFPQKRTPRGTGDHVDPLYLQLTADQFKMIADWYYYAILSLLKTKGFRNDPVWIAKRLGLGTSTVEQALERLKRLEIITENKDRTLRRTPGRYRTTDDVASLSLRKAHFANLELAHKSLEADPVTDRDFSSLTLAFSASRMNEVKVEIRKFQDEFDQKFESDENNPDEVYRLFIGFFPLSRAAKSEESS